MKFKMRRIKARLKREKLTRPDKKKRDTNLQIKKANILLSRITRKRTVSRHSVKCRQTHSKQWTVKKKTRVT
jgi:hypothetical protein